MAKNGKQKREPVTEVTIGKYRGWPVITLPVPETGEAPATDVTFGLRKAQAVLDNIGAIEAFVADNLEGGA